MNEGCESSRRQFVQEHVDVAEAALAAGEDVRAVWSAFYLALDRREDTRHHPALEGGQILMDLGLLRDPDLLRTYLQGFVTPQYESGYATKGFVSVEMTPE